MNRTLTPPSIDRERCTGCELCARACPGLVLEMRDGKASVERPDLCIECCHCSSLCPAEAVSRPGISPEPAGAEPAVTPEHIEALVRRRRSVRLYEDRAVPRELIDRMIELARFSPTGSNSQNVRYIVLAQPDAIAQLRERVLAFYGRLFGWVRHPIGALVVRLAAGRRRFDLLRRYIPLVELAKQRYDQGEDPLFHHAPAVIAVHAESWDTCSAFNCSAALYTASLVAHTLGLGCCFNGFLEGAANNGAAVKRLLGVPGGHRCFGAMTLGYPAVTYLRPVTRRGPEVRWLG